MSGEDRKAIRIVLEVNRQAQPRTVRELVNLVLGGDPHFPADQVIEIVEALRFSGELVLGPRSFSSFSSFFLNFRWNFAFWTFLMISVITGAILSLELDPPWSLVSLPFVLLLLFYFPGRAVLHLLPRGLDVSGLERVMLEFGTSFVFVLFVGLFLNFSGLGFFAGPAVGTISFFGLVLTLASSYRDYQTLHVHTEKVVAKVLSSAL